MNNTLAILMAKKIKILLFLIILSLAYINYFDKSLSASAAMDPRVRVFLKMSAYGAAGGALLGAASMAYGTKFRAVPIGASLGLYAGILFGGYIVASHYYNNQEGIEDSSAVNPYYQDIRAVGGGSDGSSEETNRWDPYVIGRESWYSNNYNKNSGIQKQKHTQSKSGDIYFNILNYQF